MSDYRWSILHEEGAHVKGKSVEAGRLAWGPTLASPAPESVVKVVLQGSRFAGIGVVVGILVAVVAVDPRPLSVSVLPVSL